MRAAGAGYGLGLFFVGGRGLVWVELGPVAALARGPTIPPERTSKRTYLIGSKVPNCTKVENRSVTKFSRNFKRKAIANSNSLTGNCDVAANFHVN